MVECIRPLAKCYVTVRPDNPRSMAAADLAAILDRPETPAVACDSIEAGVAKVLSLAEPGDVVCALGSLYFSGDVRTAAQKLLKK